MRSNADRLKIARGFFYVWLAAFVALQVIGPFLPQPFQLYAAHASMIVLFGGVVAAIAATKIWIGPYMPDRTRPRGAPSGDADLVRNVEGTKTRVRLWIAVLALLSAAGMILLPRFGVYLTRDQHHAVALAVSLVAVCVFYAARHVRQRSV